jgi:hypothetical protein
MLENYLPDIRLLSRYRFGEAAELNPEVEPEPLEEFEEPEDALWRVGLDLDEEMQAETYLVEEPEMPEAPPHFEVETYAPVPESEPQLSVDTLEQVKKQPVADAVSVVERRVLVVQIAKDEAPDRITRKIHHLHGWLGSHPGEDQFAFQFFSEGSWHEYVFPNDSVQISDSLLNQLNAFVEENSFFIRKERFEIRDE